MDKKNKKHSQNPKTSPPEKNGQPEDEKKNPSLCSQASGKMHGTSLLAIQSW